jgi:hypothetical protein
MTKMRNFDFDFEILISYAPVPRVSQWCHWCIMVILRDVTFSFDARLAAGKFVSDCSAANKCVRNKENVSIF